ncbi:MAG: leucyl/phenylalanyl-tRNA--protein transferase [Bacteroidia bacterium]
MLFRLSDELSFPHPSLAEADGLLAIGGDLTIARLLLAYRNGIFPWPVKGQPLLWFSPPERCVLFPDKLHISSSMQAVIHHQLFEITYNRSFQEVIDSCASIRRKDQKGTWITKDMKSAYLELHRLGHAHSVEVWKEGQLVGGLYGVVCGNVFCGESMFSRIPNASKTALIHLVTGSRWKLIDCQVYTSHLESMGAEMITRQDYLQLLDRWGA